MSQKITYNSGLNGYRDWNIKELFPTLKCINGNGMFGTNGTEDIEILKMNTKPCLFLLLIYYNGSNISIPYTSFFKKKIK